MARFDKLLPAAPKEGYAPSATTPIDGIRTVFVVLILLAPLVLPWLARNGDLLWKKPVPPQPQEAASVFPGTPEERIAKVAGVHFAQAEELLGWGDYSGALLKLETVRNIDPEYPGLTEKLAAVRSGLAGVTPRETRQASAARSEQALEIHRIGERRAAGARLRDRLVGEGQEVQVEVSGLEAETIRLTSLVFEDTWRQRLETDGTLAELCALGFSRVEMSDGFQYRAVLGCAPG
jgi:hypothetical protein